MLLGAKEKFLMVMASVAVAPDGEEPVAVVGAAAGFVVDVPLPELEQAARRRAAPTRVAMSR
jgi:hypothetical protein